MSSAHHQVLVDTGPLVAIFDRSDQYHRACSETLKLIRPPLRTTWPVLTEVAWLLRDQPQGLEWLWKGVESGLLHIVNLPDSALAAMSGVQQRFPALSLQMADMSLLLIAKQTSRATIFTLDRRDFSVIQRKSRGKLTLLPVDFT